ncbi:DRTGG domain-containing protein [Agrilactobacillus yilanensis]|uniref:DRTGG domain-containing protein n=1 Tax=Agrilactobacillus yilanensis TaxID=2485997 RepID=A0ABW4J736_9LACO|nr:DRTGG domain-containing protein [Agrilactobacillus yilanensis]
MTTKHEQILDYIESVPIGSKISVRSIAKALNVSEGTAYRAIKAAETKGLVTTIERVGTMRIEQRLKGKIENLTFREIVKAIDGEVYGGMNGLDKLLDKFVIGAMTLEAMERYITPKSLMIIGNREDAQRLALQNGAAVLITGGFSTSQAIMDLSEELALPVLGTTYDTFTVAAIINRVLTNQLIKKEIVTVGDIYQPVTQTEYLLNTETVRDYIKLTQKSGHSRFPVTNKQQRLLGVVTGKDILERSDKTPIEKIMTKEPLVVRKSSSAASAGHLMTWNSLEMIPVVDDKLQLQGIVSRKDIMETMQLAPRQPQVTDTFYDQMIGGLQDNDKDITEQGLAQVKESYQFEVQPQLVNNLGTIAFGVLSEIVVDSCQRLLNTHYKKNAVFEQMDLHYMKLIQLESKLTVEPLILDIGRRFAKMDVSVYVNHTLVAKAIVMCQLLERR